MADALNWSTLKHLAKSALHYRWRIDHPEPDKPSYLWGRGVHCALLEPDEFDLRYIVYDGKRDARVKAYQEFLAEHPGVDPIKQHERDSMLAAADSVRRHPVAWGILKHCRYEESLTWTDADTGLLCRGRLDAICPEYIADLKTSRDISPRAFPRDCARYMVHGQVGGMYQHGATVLRLIDGTVSPYIVAVDTEPPHDVAAYQMSAEDVAAGRQLVVSLMRQLEACIASGIWLGQVPDLQQLQLPPWAPGFGGNETEEW